MKGNLNSQESMTAWQARPVRVIIPMGLALAFSLLGDATLYAVLPTHTAEAGIALGTVGIILGVNRAIRVLLNTPVGMAYDRWPRRRLYLPAAAIGVMATLIYALSTSFWSLLMGRLLWGLAWSGLWVGANAIALDIATASQRGRLLGWAQAWFFLGGAMSFVTGGLLTDLLSYRQALWIGAGLSSAGLLAAVLFMPETWSGRRGPEASRASPEVRATAVGRGLVRFNIASIIARLSGRAADQEIRDTSVSSTGRGQCWRKLAAFGPKLRNGGWLALYAYAVLRFCMAGVVAATLSLYVKQQLGNPVRLGGVLLGASTLTGILLSARPLISLISAPSAGSLSDLHGRWTLLRWGSLIGAGSFVLLAQGDLPAIVASGLLSAVALGALSPVSSALVGDLAPLASRGRSLGWLATAGDLGSAAGPVMAYLLLPGLGLTNIYWLCTLLMGSIWLASFLRTGPAGPETAVQPDAGG